MNDALRSKWLQRCLILMMVVETLSLISSVMQLNLLDHAPFSMEAAQANDRREAIAGYSCVALNLLTIIVFSRWILVAHRTVRALGATGITITPGWAVGYFFVPFINLVRPYTAMKELWRASVDPEHAPTQTTPTLLPVWWTLWIVSGIIGQIAFRMSMHADGIDELKTVTVLSIVSCLFDVALAFAALGLVRAITVNIARHSEPPTLPAV